MTDRLQPSPQRRLLTATSWSVAAEFTARLAQPVTFILLAQFLVPEDFGVATAALMVIAFSNIFWEGGLAKAIIQTRDDNENAARGAFWINVSLGLLIAGALVALADAIAVGIFHDAKVGPVLKVISLQILLGALQSVQTALLRRRLAFRPLFWVRIAGVVATAGVALPMAIWGMGYWALVAGALLSQAATLIVVWWMIDWRPWPLPDADTIRHTCPVLRFASSVMVSTLIGWLFNWGDALIVGMFLTGGELGIYRVGSTLATQAFALLFLPLVPVAYSHFSRLAGDRPKLLRDGGELTRMIMSAAIPIGFAGFALAESLIGIAFGSDWAGLGPVVAILCLAQGISWSVSMNAEIYRAAGLPAVETIFAFSAASVYMVAYLISIQYGFEVFVWTRCALAATAGLAHVVVFCVVFRTGSLPFLIQLAQSLLAGIAIMLVVKGIFAMTGDGIPGIALGLLAGLLITSVGVIVGGHFASIRQFLARAR